jgi:2-phospho-L-lactate guanylyltransferase
VRTYVPFSPDDPKTRLSDVLDDDERVGFVRACLADVVGAVDAAGGEPVVLSTEPLGQDAPEAAEVVVRDKPLTPAVNAVLSDAPTPVAVVVADLPLVTPEALRCLYAPDAGFVVAPGRGGGTNAFVARDPRFRVDYHGTSFADHTERARELERDVHVVDSFRLYSDADEAEDLVEVILHGEGRAAGFVRERFELEDDEDRRVTVRRR